MPSTASDFVVQVSTNQIQGLKMLSGIYSAASALRTAEFQQDVISTNLAHMNVPGFRKSMTTVTNFAEELQAQKEDRPGHGKKVESLVNDFTSGPLQNTGRSLDVAIANEGFFAVQGEDETLYTRNGVFHVGESGELIGASGFPILGEGGPISIPRDVSPGQIKITTDGTVIAGEANLGKLQLVQFEDNSKLKQVGTTLFSAANATQADGAVIVQQGVREHANVSPVDEMVSMIVAMRYYEASQRTLKSINDAIQKETDPRG